MLKINPRKKIPIQIANFFINLFFYTEKDQKNIEWRKLQKILIIDFTGIGDLVMLTAFLKIIKSNSPNAQITLCCNPYGKALLWDQHLVDSFYCIDGLKYINSPIHLLLQKKLIKKYVEKINEGYKYDIAIEPRGDLRYIYLMHMINATRKISYDYTRGEALLTDVVKHSDKVKHLIEDKVYMLKKLGCKVDDKNVYPSLTIANESQKQNNKFIKDNHLENKTIIGIHPGARQLNRQWDKYPDLIENIFSIYNNCAVLVFSDGTVEHIIHSFERKHSNDKSLIIVEENFSVYKRLLAICDFLITNDSGAGHLGAAYGIPEVVIFGPSNPEAVKPYGKNKIICISYDVDCKPCYSKTCINKSYACLYNITVEMVFKAFQSLYMEYHNK